MRYQVIVGNIGTVYNGSDENEAYREYDKYVDLSIDGIGRGAHEDVSLIEDGELICESTHDPKTRRKPRQYGIMRNDVKLLGPGLSLGKGDAVVITPATNLPDPDGRVFARPRGGMWDMGARLTDRPILTWRGVEESILLDVEDYVSVTSKQKRSYLMLCKRWERKPDRIEPEFMGPAVMVNYNNLWIGIEPDGYAHS